MKKNQYPFEKQMEYPKLPMSGFLDSWLIGFLATWLLGFLASWLPGFLASWLLGFVASWLLGFLASSLLGFLASWLLGFLASWLRTSIESLSNTDRTNYRTSIEYRLKIYDSSGEQRTKKTTEIEKHRLKKRQLTPNEH